jgi:hypothetical protein
MAFCVSPRSSARPNAVLLTTIGVVGMLSGVSTPPDALFFFFLRRLEIAEVGESPSRARPCRSSPQEPCLRGARLPREERNE